MHLDGVKLQSTGCVRTVNESIVCATPSSIDTTITALFMYQVGVRPDAIAIQFEGIEVTYGELNERANRVANYLIDSGVRLGARICICIERSVEMVVGLLAILKAGGAYVPLDSRYPQERLSYMVEDCRAEVLLVQAKLAERFSGTHARLVLLDEESGPIAQCSKENPPIQISPDHLAYVIYTSGSTGRPKGVCVCHRNTVRLVWDTDYAHLGPDEVFLQFSSISFDAAAFEIWAPLLNGGRLIIFPPYMPSAGELGEWLLSSPVTTLWLTAGLFHEFMELDTGRFFSHMRQLLAGGDALSLRAAKKFLQLYPDCRLINGYGPTENATFSVCAELREMAADASTVPIGRTITHSTAFILDKNMHPVPPAEEGEIYLGGRGLAQGYWNRPGLTAAKFVPNPFSLTPGDRLYASGDRGRIRPDGNLEFLGRFDQQVKLRGYRIELGEIEAVLEQNPKVAQAVAMLREDRAGDKRLTAYVVPQQGSTLEVAELRDYLRTKLPEYMVPAAFIVLDHLPLTENGKVDRASLPLPKGDRSSLQQVYVPPQTPTETLVTRIWEDVLGVRGVGVQDNFFDLGGNSLLAGQVVARVHAKCNVLVPLRNLLERPVVANFARCVETAQYDTSSDEAPHIGTAPRSDAIPLGFSQERVWFLRELDHSSLAYNFQATLRIRGRLNVAALEKSLAEMVCRHEILRTTFVEKDGHPVQVIHDSWAVTLPVVHLEHIAQERLDQVAETMIQEEISRRFDVGRLPLIRWVLFAFGEHDYLLLHMEHHFIHDGWSFNVFLGELFLTYKALADGRPSPLAPPRIQFADFAIWQRQYVQSERAQAQLEFWKNKLSGLPVSEFPADRPRPPVQTFKGQVLRVPLSSDLSHSLFRFSSQENASLFAIMMSAFFTLAHLYTGQTDFGVGTSLANRQRPETEELLGMLVNNAVLRAQMPPGMTLGDLVNQVRELAFEAYENQDVPFQDVVRAVVTNRNLGINPLFQTTLNFHNSPVSVPEIPELALQLKEGLGNGAAKFDLGVIVIPSTPQRLRLNPEWQPDAVTMIWEYNSDLFDESTIRRTIKHYQRVLECIITNPLQRLTEVSLLDDAERQLLLGWSQASTDSSPKRCVHELFEDQARRTPDAVAIAYKQRALTYADLDRRSNQLARYLRNLGVGPEVRVGVCMARGPEMLVVQLAILKADGAYVPLDCSYPPERLAYMAEDARLKLVLTEQQVRARFVSIAENWISLDHSWATIARESEAKLASGATLENLAYVIYTSGSTGQPKGVGVAHRGLVNLVSWHQQVYKLTSADRACQVASPAFDASVWETWPYLLSGSCIDLPDQAVVEEPDKLFEWMAEREITICFLPTPLAEVFASKQSLPRLRLRTLLTGGDRLHQGNWSSLPCPVTNHYGPTENTVVSTSCLAASGSVPPIGKPIANVQIYVLNEEYQPAPVGVPGELYLGGASLARGYLDRPALTAQKFVPNPFSTVPGERLYRTGDVVRFLPDGNLEFLGRKDQQVKLRGFRIELGEIEAALMSHPQVRHAVAMVRDEGAVEKRLVAYVVPRERGAILDTNELRTYLQAKLPAHMVPASWITLDELPLTANGKVNQDALPAPERRKELHRSPRTPREEALCAIFAEALSIESVSIDDDFFALGGHSLLGTSLVSRIRTTIGAELTLRTLFECPTVAQLAPHLDNAASVRPALRGIKPRPARVPLSYAQQRLWFLDKLQGSSTEYNLCEALALRGKLNLPALQQAIAALLQRHESLRTHFEEHGGEPVQVIEQSVHVPVSIEDLTHLASVSRQERLTAAMRQGREQPFDLSRGPLVRVKLVKMAEEEHVLLLSFHHIVCDGWSQGIFNQELFSLYEAFQQGREPDLEGSPIQYADFALWQRKMLQEDVLNPHLEYWKKQLSGIPEQLALPRDRPRPSVQTFRAEQCRVNLPSESLSALKNLSQNTQTTLFMTLLAGFAVLLQRYSGQDDIVVGSPIANRQDVQLEQLIGFFVNSLVLRVYVNSEQSFHHLLQAVRNLTLEAYAHQDVPFERLVEALSPRRSLNVSPIFQVLFALQNAPTASQQVTGLEIEPLKLPGLLVHFDLELHAREHDRNLELHWVYNPDLFDSWRIEQMARHYVRLLQAVAATPEERILELEILAEDEKRQLLETWNATETAYPHNKCLHNFVEEQAAHTPHAVAVTCGHAELSYAQLNQQANQLAHYLLVQGAKPEARVAICLERSIQSITALIGTLKAGAAYVALDPDYPQERLNYMLEDSNASFLVTENKFLGLTSRFTGKTVLLDHDQTQIACESDENPRSIAVQENLAYVIYTSGSTGKPKGVAIRHHSAVAFVSWAQTVFSKEELQCALASTSLCFDLSIFEIFVPLSCGGRVIVTRNALDLTQPGAADGVTLINTVPSAMKELLRTNAIPTTVQTVNLAGEALQSSLVKQLYQLPHIERVFNLYGPSEDTTYSTYAQVRPEQADGSVPIGRPIANTQVYVLDGQMRLAPAGAVGELYIGGDGLARGYLNSPGLTAERFLPDPFSGKCGARLYSTGDLVRYRVDGDLEFIGRRDHQLKIRGFRIELGEIEAALRNYEGVLDSLVIAREDASGNQSLFGYVVQADGASLHGTDLRSRLRQILPEYMVPSSVQVLTSWPLTANGKLNRKALPNPEMSVSEFSFVAPQSELEKSICTLWKDLLHIEKVGIFDNFFDIGGHSLLAIRLHAALRELTGEPLPVTDLFKYPTIATMARHLTRSDQHQPEGEENPELKKLKEGKARLKTFSRNRPLAAEPVHEEF